MVIVDVADAAAPAEHREARIVRTAEMEISDADFGECLKDIRVWLDANRFAPSSFTYFFLSPGMRLRVAFDIEGQATAFATRFGAILVDASDPCRPDAERKRNGQQFVEKAN